MSDIGDMLVDANNEGYKEGYQQGRADRNKELNKRYCCYSDRDCEIGNLVEKDIRIDTIDRCIEIVRDGCYRDTEMLIEFLEKEKGIRT